MNKAETFNDGMAQIFKLENTAENGDKPKYKLKLKALLRFGHQTMTLKRKVAAFQYGAEATDIIRVPLNRSVWTNDVVILNSDRQQYNIQLVQHIMASFPPKTVLTLVRLERSYDIKSV